MLAVRCTIRSHGHQFGSPHHSATTVNLFAHDSFTSDCLTAAMGVLAPNGDEARKDETPTGDHLFTHLHAEDPVAIATTISEEEVQSADSQSQDVSTQQLS